MNFRWSHLCLLGVMCAVSAAWSEPRQPADADRPDGKDQRRAERKDGALATCLIVDNQNEVELARLAQERSQNPAVKAFAQKMEADHTKLVEQLDRFAASYTGPGKRAARGAKVDVDVTKDGARADEPPAKADIRIEGGRPDRGPGLDFVALKQELGAECLRSARAELESKEGAEFDKCYIGMALGHHMYAIDAMTVFARHSSSELASTLNKGVETAQQHLAHAKQLMKQLDSPGANTTRQAN